MIGIHIDRFASDDSGAICKQPWSLILPDALLLPFWTDEALHLRWREYTPAAVVMHSGDDASGHLQASLLSPQGWYISEDRRVASIDDPEMSSRLTDIVFVWLIRDDCVDLAAPAPCRYGRDDLALRVARSLHSNNAAQIMSDETLAHFLRSSCGACGCLIFGAAALRKHIHDVHPGLWLELRRTYQSIMAKFKCYQLPCGLCETTLPWPSCLDNLPDHDCKVILTMAVCKIYQYMELSHLGSNVLL